MAGTFKKLYYTGAGGMRVPKQQFLINGKVEFVVVLPTLSITVKN
jgi:hypothetical protein